MVDSKEKLKCSKVKMSKKTNRLEIALKNRATKIMEEEEEETVDNQDEVEEIGGNSGNEDDKIRESDSETEEKKPIIESDCKSESSLKQKSEKRFDKSKLSLLNFRLNDKSRRDSSPEIKDDGSEHSNGSKTGEEKTNGLRIPFSEAPLGTGPGRGVLFGATAARSPHFPPPVFMWCPTIGLPPWCPALFPTGLVSSNYFS